MEKAPRIKKPTAKQQAEIDEEQMRRAALLNISMSPSQREFARACAMIKSFEEYHTLPLAAVAPYADALAMVGDYAKAYELTGNETYKQIMDAMAVRKTCTCPDTVDTVMENGQPVQKTYSRFFVKRQVYKDRTWYDLKQCNKCGLMTL